MQYPTFPTLDELKQNAAALASTYEIQWDAIAQPTELMDMKRLLATSEDKLPALEKYYTTLASADPDKLSVIASSMGIHQYTGLLLDLQDDLVDAWVARELMARITGVLSLTEG